jgi:hypothetical protein
MTLDRRTFVAGTAAVALAPAVSVLPAQLPAPEIASERPVLMIAGWSIPDEDGAADAFWIRIGHSWRTAWR